MLILLAFLFTASPSYLPPFLVRFSLIVLVFLPLFLEIPSASPAYLLPYSREILSDCSLLPPSFSREIPSASPAYLLSSFS